ncbi:hypothetical protein [Aphanothece hegewaldii]|uniref:hypothetical protein n=1 Tax=Aphanothece hegewaldii TaxID=1521625 RepID=UPI001C636565|nr:hypothetical protein [Aphanothece hegewaldii]
MYTQLLTLEQDSKVINLLHFPKTPLLPTVFKLRSRLWSKGRTFVTTPKDISQLINNLSKNKFNEVKVIYNFAPDNILSIDITIHKITNILTLAPSNSLWEPTGTYKALKKTDESLRASFESQEIFVKRNNSIYPNLLEIFIEFELGLN